VLDSEEDYARERSRAQDDDHEMPERTHHD
jgi:hypothetical protein